MPLGPNKNSHIFQTNTRTPDRIMKCFLEVIAMKSYPWGVCSCKVNVQSYIKYDSQNDVVLFCQIHNTCIRCSGAEIRFLFRLRSLNNIGMWCLNRSFCQTSVYMHDEQWLPKLGFHLTWHPNWKVIASPSSSCRGFFCLYSQISQLCDKIFARGRS